MLLGPRNTDNVFGEEELEPYCKFCFAKKFKVMKGSMFHPFVVLGDEKHVKTDCGKKDF